MIFQRRAKKQDCNFCIGNEKIYIVQNYTYLGTQISSTGNLSLEHNTQGKGCSCSLQIKTKHGLQQFETACKIFDTMISPILTYNSEVWGLSIKSDFKYSDTSPTEKGRLQFCNKRYLQVNNKGSNIACRAELGRYPIIFDINKRINS